MRLLLILTSLIVSINAFSTDAEPPAGDDVHLHFHQEDDVDKKPEAHDDDGADYQAAVAGDTHGRKKVCN